MHRDPETGLTTVISTGHGAPLYRGLRMSADEYLVLPDDGYRYELIDGVVCMSPSPSPAHQRVATRIAVQIGRFLERHPLGEVIMEVDVRLAPAVVYRPDVIFLSTAKLAQCAERVTVPPDLVVEVVSPDSRRLDVETKRHDYERFGVTEYWLIDPERREFHFYFAENGQFVEATPKGTRLSSRVLPGFTLQLRPIRQLFAD